MSCQGNGLPETIRLRTYQYPPPTTIAPIHSAAARRRYPAPLIQITPTVSARTGGTTVSFVPSASPAASPATSRVPDGGPGKAEGSPPRRRSGQRALSSSATEERKSAIATTSLFAFPGCREKRRLAAITEATAATPTGPVPYGRPIR